MFICICNALSEADIDNCITECIKTDGCCKPLTVYQKFECGLQCGKCACEVEEMINDHHATPAASSSLEKA